LVQEKEEVSRFGASSSFLRGRSEGFFSLPLFLSFIGSRVFFSFPLAGKSGLSSFPLFSLSHQGGNAFFPPFFFLFFQLPAASFFEEGVYFLSSSIAVFTLDSFLDLDPFFLLGAAGFPFHG